MLAPDNSFCAVISMPAYNTMRIHIWTKTCGNSEFTLNHANQEDVDAIREAMRLEHQIVLHENECIRFIFAPGEIKAIAVEL